MKTILVAGLFAVSTFAMPTMLLTTPANALTCGVDAPEGWERPGGFCDALKSTNSLSTPVEGPEEVDCMPEGDIGVLLRNLEIGQRILVATSTPCPTLL